MGKTVVVILAELVLAGFGYLLMTSDLADAAGIDGHAFGRHALRGFDRPVDIVGIPDDPAPEPEQSRAEPG